MEKKNILIFCVAFLFFVKGTPQIKLPKNVLILVTLLSLSFNSCSNSKDNSNEVIPPNSLVGKWMKHDVTPLGDNTFTMNDCVRESYIQFDSNGTFERVSYYDASFGEVPGEISCELEAEEVGTYNYLNNQITLEFDDVDEGQMIEIWNNVNISGSTLSYSWDETDDEVDDWSIIYEKLQ